MMARIAQSEIDRIRSEKRIADIAGVPLRASRMGRGLTGPCPFCGGSDRGQRFEIRLDTNTFVCAVCQAGGDVIRFVELRDGCDFRGAVERLGGGAEAVDPELERQRAAERRAREAERARTAARRAETERRRLYDIWQRAAPPSSPSIAGYLARRGIWQLMSNRLRAVEDMPYYHGREARPGRPDKDRARVVHRGPAMLAPIVGPDGAFSGLHITWIDLAQPKGKAMILDPDTGEALPAKKVRGVKVGGRIELIRCASPIALVIGEGIETVLSVWTAMAAVGRDLDGIAFWSSVDLGNLGGHAAGLAPHPTARRPDGSPLRIPGPVPDMDARAIPVPDSVARVLLLGDGDSDRFLTETTLQRAARRYARLGRDIRRAFAPDGKDFNNLLMEAAA
ncbi:hypothetical protein GCM10019059_07540 [Camelimonas fluminis]|uniref:CHC2 zinc finger domain-containing protein n=1 Tax=Camelimonas fluminis TaxID=1576911 RepID=A0ABV7UEW5_9HYPH|nr:CHC2 zinc finger domain-containing protein [Camelimonas fluminis]GHE50901.1 hypothetical protein GCM10019059_07540 [Camelimonas fluminis]